MLSYEESLGGIHQRNNLAVGRHGHRTVVYSGKHVYNRVDICCRVGAGGHAQEYNS